MLTPLNCSLVMVKGLIKECMAARHGRKGPDGFCVLRVKFDAAWQELRVAGSQYDDAMMIHMGCFFKSPPKEVEVPTHLVDLRSTSELDPLRVRMCASIGKALKSPIRNSVLGSRC